jgi:segregation and condensation protein B
MDEQLDQSQPLQPQIGMELNPEADAVKKAGLESGKLKSIIVSLLFVNEKPIETPELCEVLGCSRKDLEKILDELMAFYQDANQGLCIVRVAGGYQMCSLPDNEEWIKKLYHGRNAQKLSIAALESLAIIAYKQPITKMEIEAIRGVNVDGVLRNLTNLGLIKIEGRKEVIGRPFLYITTRKFLEYFGLNSLTDLPKLEDFASLAQKEDVLAAEGAPDESSAPVLNDISQIDSPETVQEDNSVSNSVDSGKKEEGE